MHLFTRVGIFAALTFGAPVALAASASAQADHSDPCPGQHVQVYADLGGKGIDNGGAEPTDHFVCKGDFKGDKGDTGATGNDGPAGPQGPAGAAGVSGEAGAAGEAGADGLNGSTGEAGPAGPAGVGVAGPAGAAGHDGAAGAAGPRGLDGVNGKAGVTKTVIVKADGTTQVIDGLPHTGASTGEEWVIGLAALALVGAGTASVLVARRNHR